MDILNENTVLQAQICLWQDTINTHKLRLKVCPIKERQVMLNLITNAECVLDALLAYKHTVKLT